jgi:hypothetical protein
MRGDATQPPNPPVTGVELRTGLDLDQLVSNQVVGPGAPQAPQPALQGSRAAADPAARTGRIAQDQGVRGDVAQDYRADSDQGVLPDLDTGRNAPAPAPTVAPRRTITGVEVQSPGPWRCPSGRIARGARSSVSTACGLIITSSSRCAPNTSAWLPILTLSPMRDPEPM